MLRVGANADLGGPHGGSQAGRDSGVELSEAVADGVGPDVHGRVVPVHQGLLAVEVGKEQRFVAKGQLAGEGHWGLLLFWMSRWVRDEQADQF